MGKKQRIANISINSNIHKNTFRKYFSYEEFEDTKGILRIRKSKKDRQHNGQKKKDKMTNNDLQNITHKPKERVTRTLLKTGGELRCSERVSTSSSTSGTS